MARFLLDTNICAYIQRRKPEVVSAHFTRLGPRDAAISVITYGEMFYGAEKSDRRDQILRALDEFVSLVAVQPLPEAAAAVYGEVRASLEARGQVIGNNDLWIAAHAKAAGLILVSNNAREFRRIPRLKIENWAA